MKLLDLREGFLVNFPDKNSPLEFQHVEIHSQDNS
jgi:hypothetical protein